MHFVADCGEKIQFQMKVPEEEEQEKSGSFVSEVDEYRNESETGIKKESVWNGSTEEKTTRGTK